MSEDLNELPSAAGTIGEAKGSKAAVPVADAADDDIQARLDNLRRE